MEIAGSTSSRNGTRASMAKSATSTHDASVIGRSAKEPHGRAARDYKFVQGGCLAPARRVSPGRKSKRMLNQEAGGRPRASRRRITGRLKESDRAQTYGCRARH